MSELYTRSFCDVVPDKGVRIHIEVFAENWADAVSEVFNRAFSIRDEYDRVGKDYPQPFGPRGKSHQVEINEEPLNITERL